MIRFYSQSGGAQDFEIGSPALSQDEWMRLKGLVCALLRKRALINAADLFEKIPLNIYNGTNHFNDEFLLLYIAVPLEEYIEMEGLKNDENTGPAFRLIVNAFSELGRHIRFVTIGILEESTQIVPPPEPSITTATIDRALRDAELLISTSGPVSAVDRAHTALHGYLREICNQAGLNPANQASITELYSTLRNQHPVLSNLGMRVEEVRRILNSFSTVIDQLNAWRNKASIAHANQITLDNAEAVLAINSARTILHYIDAKLSHWKYNRLYL